MAYPYSQILTAVTGNPLTATDWNNEQQNHANNNIPTAIDDSSATTTAMRTTADPGESGTESLATDLQGEIERIRFALKEIKNTTYWYETPAKDLTTLMPKSGGTFTGAVTMGADTAMATFKLTGLGAGSAAGHSVRFEQLKVIQYNSAVLANASAFSTTSSTYADTGLTVAITPTSAANKIIIWVSGGLQTAVQANTAALKLVGGNSNLVMGVFRPSASATSRDMSTFMYVDSPATTSATTYKVQLASLDNASTSTFLTGGGEQGQIVVMEVAS